MAFFPPVHLPKLEKPLQWLIVKSDYHLLDTDSDLIAAENEILQRKKKFAVIYNDLAPFGKTDDASDQEEEDEEEDGEEEEFDESGDEIIGEEMEADEYYEQDSSTEATEDQTVNSDLATNWL